MNIKNLALTSTMALALMGSSLTSATASTTAQTSPMTKIGQDAAHTKHQKHQMWKLKSWRSCHQGRQGSRKLLTIQQKAELHTIKQSLFTELRPLIKEKHALRLQLMGKIATPNMQWSEVAVVLNKVNENNAKISTLLAKTQLSTFQKLGVTLPFHHKHRA